VKLWLGRFAVLVVAVGIWMLLVVISPSLKGFISDPETVARSLKEILSSGNFYANLEATLRAVALGFLFGCGSGIVIGFILGEIDWLDRLLDPWLAVLNAVPRIALAPVFILWFGISTQAKVALAFTVVIFVQILSTRAGVRGVDRDIRLVSRLAGMSRFATIRKVVLPSSIPSTFAGLRLGFVYSLLGVVTSEMIAARQGVGQLIVYSAAVFKMGEMFAYLVVLAAVAGVINEVFGIAERRLQRWQGIDGA
jgi:NitT/TauT family transport system permease protein